MDLIRIPIKVFSQLSKNQVRDIKLRMGDIPISCWVDDNGVEWFDIYIRGV